MPYNFARSFVVNLCTSGSSWVAILPVQECPQVCQQYCNDMESNPHSAMGVMGVRISTDDVTVIMLLTKCEVKVA